MSNNTSPAQFVPSLVLREVLDYAVNGSRNVYGEVDVRDDAIKEMLSVCSAWRQVAKEYIWKSTKLIIDNMHTGIYCAYPEWAERFELPHDAANMIRELHLVVPHTSIFSGAAYKLLSKYMGDTTNLPLVRRLFVWITNATMDEKYSTEDATNNALEYAQLLKSLVVDTTTRTEVRCVGKQWELVKAEEATFGIFLNSLFSTTKSPFLDLNVVDIKSPLALGYISQLTSLVVCCKSRPGLNISLVRKCANTLIDLDIGIYAVEMLFHDTDSNAVVYPSLQKLRLSLSNRHSDELESFPNIVPFPSLVDLEIAMPYPFADDVLFRGNSTSLRSVSLGLDSAAARILNSYRVFQGKHENLQVSISTGNRPNDRHPIPELDLEQLILDVMSSARSLHLYINMPFKSLIEEAPSKHGFRYLQSITAHWLELSVFDMLCLLKVAPALVEITCDITNLGNELKNIGPDELPDYIASTFGKTGRNLQVWHRVSYEEASYKDSIEPVILLALSCPKFNWVKLEPRYVSDYRARMAEALLSDKYRKYASRISQIRSIAIN